MNTKSLKKDLFLKILLLFLIVSLMGLSVALDYQRVVTYGILPITLLLIIKKNNFNFSFIKNNSIKHYFLILILSVLLMFQAIHIDVALTTLIQMAGVLIGGVIVVESIRYKKDVIPWILICFVLGFYVSIYFMFKNINSDLSVDSSYIDRSSYDLNANKYSYYSFLANFALFFLIELKKKNIYVVLSILTSILGVYVSFYTVSRSGMVFSALAALVYWFFIFNSNTSTYIKMIKNLIAVIVVFMIFQKVSEIYSNSHMKTRVERGISEGDSREYLMKDALDVFMDHPFLGVGPAQFAFYGKYHPGSYSHNSYLEAATNLGVTGVLLILILFFKPLHNSLRIRDKGLKHVSIMFLLFFILFNNLYVFYWSIMEMMFFFLVTEIYYLDKRRYTKT